MANVIGSNIFNITVIVGLCALMHPVAIAGNTIRLEYPVLALVTLLCLALAQDGEINRLDAVLCIAVYAAFTAYSRESGARAVDRRREARAASDGGERAIGCRVTDARRYVSGALVVSGIGLLVAGANAAVTGAVEVARLLGWSERVIGLTIISAGTGLPEVVASTMSSIRGRSDIAIGNVIGSNLFNILGVLGLTAIGLPLKVQPALLASDVWWMLGTTRCVVSVDVHGTARQSR